MRVPEDPLLSVVITTKNEAANIAACVRSFERVRDRVEVIVVDNGSTDDTKAIAASLGARVLDKGPERCAQRNFGWRAARADWIVILDADMTLPAETVAEILEIADGTSVLRVTHAQECARAVTGTAESAADGGPAAYWIPEVRTGTGFRTKARNFERSFYDGTCIDALRLYHKSVLEATGGYDENLIPGGEDWELDIRILATGAKCALLKNHLVHNEKQLSLAKLLEKKAYYTKGVAMYRAKWPDHPSVRRQFSPWYRFVGVFVENGKWRKILRHPVLFAAVFAERLLVGVTYLRNRGEGRETRDKRQEVNQ